MTADSPSLSDMRDSEKMPFSLELRLVVKQAVVRLRDEIADAFEKEAEEWRVTLVRASDVQTLIDEIERLMLVNGQIAKLWAEANDRASDFRPPTDSVPLSEMLPKSFSVLLDTFNDDDYDRAYTSIESAFSNLREEADDLRKNRDELRRLNRLMGAAQEDMVALLREASFK